MTSTKLKVFSIVGLLAVFAFLYWQQQQRIKHLTEDNAALRAQIKQLAQVQQENQRLADELKSTAERTQKEHAELLRLRAQTVTLKQTAQENTKLKAERDLLAKQAKTPALTTEESPEEENAEKKFAIAKLQYGRHWGLALMMYANDNKGQFPASFAAASHYVDPDQLRTATGTYEFKEEQFELAYQGLQEDIKDSSQTILIKEKEPLQRADGQ
ncbi:MAG: hypothetical protein JWQ71_1008 [Pedosphaera sp.]|nr:hypothetical protein [Pedosphaera sp.]